jgi:hypothetical protein
MVNATVVMLDMGEVWLVDTCVHAAVGAWLGEVWLVHTRVRAMCNWLTEGVRVMCNWLAEAKSVRMCRRLQSAHGRDLPLRDHCFHLAKLLEFPPQAHRFRPRCGQRHVLLKSAARATIEFVDTCRRPTVRLHRADCRHRCHAPVMLTW